MINGETSGQWRRGLRYIFGAALLLLAAVATSVGVQWYLSLIAFCAALMFILGRRRIFRAGVTRAGDEIICRYIPWYEGNVYVLNVLFPLLAVAGIGAGSAPGNPAWLRFIGILLLVLTPIFVSSAVCMWRRCLLCISPSVLTVRLTAPKEELTEISRECVVSIEPKIVPNGVSGQSLQVAISYRATGLSSESKTVLLGLQLTIQPINLLNALIAWKDGAHENPCELLDRVEGILRGNRQ
ncbi:MULTISPECIES: hypothetical protein [Mycobacterium]|uniref:Uncharacterized protein n=2 Tax=Mycobacterium avium complex (MAC) TaxID=120793 RepID=A0ABN6ANE1_9MYCO|nr:MULTISPECIES: hypothetical protein [Mycobacterium]AFS16802.1 Hypothetical protein MIP_07135 [Mycobacterium intracellulare subsp. intracellulare MTCC 9506]OSC30346.1 hypothetical protein B8W68_01645 [Mycobacterium paraintracellulare]WRU82011.1 hypothetical protein P6281_23935 [Mycobacterium sp. 5-140-3-2]WSE41836.1 hypothetical protein QGN28_02180 [Mycobacterium sp. 5-140-3-1]WSE51933.1 hypothetical protein QGN31_02165 [Mycobacterium sp. 2-64]